VGSRSAVARTCRSGGARLIGETQRVVLYDEDCGFCRWSLDKILAWDRAKRLRAAPIQSAEGDRLLSELDPGVRLDSWHLVNGDGRVFSGGAAAAPLARLLPGGRPLAALFTAFPSVTDRAYRYVADHRDRWARLLRIDAGCEVRRR
jgi:predicted DCC family thiol-disulfide oxidoreductase YuxK